MPSKYKLSPSSSERFLTCTASLPYNIEFTENEATLKGNLQHSVAFLRLAQIYMGKDHTKEIERLTDYSHEYVSTRTPSLKVKWDKDCERTVDNYIGYIKRMVQQFQPSMIAFEFRVKMTFFDNAINGVVDCVMVLPNNDIIIIDLKTGRVKVETEDNSQMLMYAYGIAQDLYKKTEAIPQNIIVSICQSLVNNTKAVKYSVSQLAKWYSDNAQAMFEINTDKLVFRPSKNACHYCQHRADCNERIRAGVV